MTDRAAAASFRGVIGPTWRESTPWWEPEPEPPAGAPNVLVVVLDDVGFAQLGCYGSDIATPTIDRLAADGLRLTNFHTTALCSPTRACLLTGRNHHRNGMARVADLALGYPGYDGRIPRANGFVSEILTANGYAAYAVGKWHITPDDETHMAAPRDSWPLGRGFQRWYGFHGGETHQFVPWLFADNHTVAPPGAPGDGYHLSADLADTAIEYLRDLRAVDDTQRFLLWFATGACHSPHHAPAEWIARYRGQFDDGWDAWRARTHARQLELGVIPTGTELAPRPPWVPAWDALEPDDQAVAARFMECFAGFLSYTDAQLGRLIGHLERAGELDDTLVILVSDNGASAEGGEKGSINDVRLWNGLPAGRKELRARIDELGGPNVHNNYPWGWTMAGNTPLKRWKREVHEGGIADPCIVRWPARIGGAAAGSVRRQFVHAIDVFPTVLELCGIESPAVLRDVPQSRVDGTSFVYLIDDPDAPERHTTQYFEMLGSRAIYHDGWKAVTFKPMGGMYSNDDARLADAPWDDDVWELYDKRNDFSECHDRAAEEPERLRAMIDLWWREARANDVLPLDNRPLAAILDPRPGRRRDRPRYVLSPFGAPLPEVVGPNVKNRTHRIVATVTVPDGGEPNGVIAAMGSVLGGFSFYLLDGRPHYAHNHVGRSVEHVRGEACVGAGEHEVRVELFAPGDYSAEVRLLVDGELVGEGKVATFTAARFSITGGGLTCGYDHGPAVSPDYTAPFRADFDLRDVIVEVEGTPHVDAEAEFAAIMSEQ